MDDLLIVTLLCPGNHYLIRNVEDIVVFLELQVFISVENSCMFYFCENCEKPKLEIISFTPLHSLYSSTVPLILYSPFNHLQSL